MARLPSEQLHVQELRTPVAFPKRVDVVYVSDDDASFTAECLATEAAQEALVGQAPMHVGHANRNEADRLKQGSALLYLNSPDFTGPVVDILKRVAMNGPEMIEIEATARSAFNDSLRHQATFVYVKRSGVPQPELVAQNAAYRIDVGVLVLHDAIWRR